MFVAKKVHLMLRMARMQRKFVAIMMAVFFTACSKNEILEVDNETQSIVDFSIIDQEIMGIFPGIYQHLSNTGGAGGRANPVVTCVPFNYINGDTIIFSPAASYSLDVSETSCSITDGKTRSGQLLISLSSKFRNVGSNTIIKLRNYRANDLVYGCDSIVVDYIGEAGNHESYLVKVINATCTTENFSFTYSTERTLAVYPKTGTANSKSSNYGTANGVNRTGLTYSVLVKKDLIKENNCAFYSAGILEIVPKGFKTRQVNFGDGSCDDEANYTVNENTVAFKLK